jgi:hypothetical protein
MRSAPVLTPSWNVLERLVEFFKEKSSRRVAESVDVV